MRSPTPLSSWIIRIGTTLVLLVGALALPAATASPASPAADDSAKISPELRAELAAPGADPFFIELAGRADLTAASQVDDWTQRGRAVVDALKETAEKSQAAVVSRLRAQGATVTPLWIDNSVYVENGTQTMVMTAVADDGVRSVRPAGSVPLAQPEKSQRLAAVDDVEWGVADIRAEQVWQTYADRGEGVVVANIDSGVQFDHPALAAAYRGNLGGGQFDHNYNWFDPSHVCGTPSLAPCDNAGHGSHTMGTIVGDGGPGNKVGVAPGATWIAAKGCESSSCSDLALAASAQWMLAPTDLAGENPDPARRPHIINNSWGGPAGNDWYHAFVDAWVASGIFPAFSNGNSGPGCRTSGDPGEYDASYSVGNYASNGVISSTSSRGPGTTEETKPNISAPGTNVRSSLPGNTYGVYSGTSMAGPHVAGTIALAWSAAPSLVGDIEATRLLLDDTARDKLDTQCGGDADDNNVYGEGQVDALAAVTAAPRGEQTGVVSGTVRDTATGKPVPGARVAFTGPSVRTVTADAQGRYSVRLSAGRYAVEATTFGYHARESSLELTADQTRTLDIGLVPSSYARLSGTVRDTGEHGWPVYARVSLDGTPVETFTDPATGRYSVQVPVGRSYVVRVEPEYPGYTPTSRDISMPRATTADVGLDVDVATCTAPGYGRPAGTVQSFDSGTTPTGWTVDDATGAGQVWRFDDPGRRGNLTGGDGGFAVVDSFDYGRDSGTQDTSLVSPTVDLSQAASPVLEFSNDFKANFLERADADLSVDGGATWTNVWRATDNVRGPGQIRVPVPAAAGQPQVQVRFHYYRAGQDWWWQVDDVFLGEPTCEREPGALVVGRTVSTRGKALSGARVVSDDRPTDDATSRPTPDDPGLGDGFYWLFSSLLGKVDLTASTADYSAAQDRLRLASDEVVEHDFELTTGELEVSTRTISADVPAGQRVTRTMVLTNKGHGPASYEIEEYAGAAPQPAAATVQGGAVRRIPADASPLQSGGAATDGAGDAGTEAEPWVTVARHPQPIKDTAAGVHDGRLYTFGGAITGPPLDSAFTYDPAGDTWSPVATMPETRQKPSSGFIDGEFVMTGGWGAGGLPLAATTIYDPATDSYHAGAPNPTPLGAPGSAVLDGKLYSVGGCVSDCGARDVMRYDPEADAWERLADYPQNTAWASCGGMRGKVYCAGGIGPEADGLATYAYTPATDSWQRVADMPLDLWASAVSVVDGRLVVAGGSVDRGSLLTNEAVTYDPRTDAWSPLPSAGFPRYRTTGACGFYKIGGSEGFFGDPVVEMLPGYGDCAEPTDVPWLRVHPESGTVKSAHRRTVQVVLDARGVSRPGTYRARLRIDDDTPGPPHEVMVTMRVTG